MSLEKTINRLVDEACQPKAKKYAHKFAFDILCVKLRAQMRGSGMTNKEINIEMKKINEGIEIVE